MKTIKGNGAEIPVLGFGTWELKGDTARGMTAKAIQIGYRHIDTAQAYENEAEVGAGIADSGVARDEIFVTTKVWRDQFHDGDLQTSLKASLDRLKLDHVDLALLHWPVPEVPIQETMEALNAAREDGLTRNIGLSNFTVELMKKAVKTCPGPVANNQIEHHVYLDQSKVIEAARDLGLTVTAYSPLGQGNVFDEPVLKRIGQNHGKNAAQVALRWLVQRDIIAIPRTGNPDHAQANFEIFDFTLSDTEMKDIAGLARPDGREIDPGWAPQWDQPGDVHRI